MPSWTCLCNSPYGMIIAVYVQISPGDMITKSDKPIETRPSVPDDYRDRLANPHVAVARSYIDNVIDQTATRRKSIRALVMPGNRTDSARAGRKHRNTLL